MGQKGAKSTKKFVQSKELKRKYCSCYNKVSIDY